MIRSTLPKVLVALPAGEVADRLTEIALRADERLAQNAEGPRTTIASLPRRGRWRRFWSYLERCDIPVIELVTDSAFPSLRRIAQRVRTEGGQAKDLRVRLPDRSTDSDVRPRMYLSELDYVADVLYSAE
jgi:hypothetical protein